MSDKVLITSALLYVNGIPHLGHLAGCLLPADVFARYSRLLGKQVLFPYATDEHGTPSELGAAKEGVSPLEYTTKYHNLHREIYKAFNISFDFIGRTSSPTNAEMTQKIALEIAKNGYIEERETEQMYSETDGRFLPDRYVEGTCPYCGSAKARGDQCEDCTKLLSPEKLLNPRSAVSGATDLIMKKTTHLYFKLSKLSGKLREWVDSHPDWANLTRGIAYKWLDEGLEDRSITRDLSWGVPVPAEFDLPGKVFYVWFDAPIGYISATKEAVGDKWTDWWLDKDVKYYEFMGKDNVPFHTVFFPAMEIASGGGYKLADVIKGQSYLNFNGGKFSKSAHRGIFADDAAKEFQGEQVDFIRYSIMKNLPESDDADFSFERLADDVNKDLNDVLGNFALRILKFYRKNWGDTVKHNAAAEPEITADVERRVAKFHEHFQNLEYKKAMAELRAIWVVGNEYIDAKAPWTLAKTNPDSAGEVLVFAMSLLRLSAGLASPIIPMLSDKILSIFQVKPCLDLNGNQVKVGDALSIPETLFAKITPERLAELNEKYNKN